MQDFTDSQVPHQCQEVLSSSHPGPGVHCVSLWHDQGTGRLSDGKERDYQEGDLDFPRTGCSTRVLVAEIAGCNGSDCHCSHLDTIAHVSSEQPSFGKLVSTFSGIWSLFLGVSSDQGFLGMVVERLQSLQGVDLSCDSDLTKNHVCQQVGVGSNLEYLVYTGEMGPSSSRLFLQL